MDQAAKNIIYGTIGEPYWLAPGNQYKGKCHANQITNRIALEIKPFLDFNNSGKIYPRQPTSSPSGPPMMSMMR